MTKQILGTVCAFVFGFIAIFGGLYVYRIQTTVDPPVDVPGLLWPNPIQIMDFSIVDSHNQPFDLMRIKGKWTFWYFGYTNCPDACPLAMTIMQGVEKSLNSPGEKRNDIQFVFVSLDPARDSLAHLNAYVEFFHPEFIAATGTEKTLPPLIHQFGVLRSFQEPDEDGNYFVDHTTALLLTDPQARFVGIFQQPHVIEQIIRQFNSIHSFVEAL